MITTIAESSHVGEARRAATELARRAKGNETQLSRIALVATEMATNIVKHAVGGGMLITARFHDGDGDGIELMAVDKGPGMPDIKTCLSDGFSTAGSPGTGLGAIVRQADRFGIYSRPGLGTAIMARLRFALADRTPFGTEIGAVIDPYPGLIECGDKWIFGAGNRGRTLFVVDGSGHGIEAARAADIAAVAFHDNLSEECVPLVERMHRALMPTRGAALAIARIDAGAQVVRFVGVGNITGAIVSGGEARQMISHHGIAGHIAPRIREYTYPFSGTPCVVMHSDGLSNRWHLPDYPGLAASHPSLIAAILFRDFRRGRDDATVAIMRPR